MKKLIPAVSFAFVVLPASLHALSYTEMDRSFSSFFNPPVGITKGMLVKDMERSAEKCAEFARIAGESGNAESAGGLNSRTCLQLVQLSYLRVDHPSSPLSDEEKEKVKFVQEGLDEAVKMAERRYKAGLASYRPVVKRKVLSEEFRRESLLAEGKVGEAVLVQEKIVEETDEALRMERLSMEGSGEADRMVIIGLSMLKEEARWLHALMQPAAEELAPEQLEILHALESLAKEYGSLLEQRSQSGIEKLPADPMARRAYFVAWQILKGAGRPVGSEAGGYPSLRGWDLHRVMEE